MYGVRYDTSLIKEVKMIFDNPRKIIFFQSNLVRHLEPDNKQKPVLLREQIFLVIKNLNLMIIDIFLLACLNGAKY